MTSRIACPMCGWDASLEVRPREVAVGRWSAVVEDECYVCSRCGEEFHRPGQTQVTLEKAAKAIRQQKGLISPERIRALRTRYELTQEQLERLLGVSPKMVVRWERGTVLPTLAAGRLLEVLESVPEGVFRSLAAHHGVQLSLPKVLEAWPDIVVVPIPRNVFSANFQMEADPYEPMGAVA